MESLKKIGLAVGQTPLSTQTTPVGQDLSQERAPSPSSSGGIIKKLLTVFSFLTIIATIIAVLKSKLLAAGALLGQLLGKLNIGSLFSGMTPKLNGVRGGKGKKSNLKKSSYTPKRRGGGGIGASGGGKRKKKGIKKFLR